MITMRQKNAIHVCIANWHLCVNWCLFVFMFYMCVLFLYVVWAVCVCQCSCVGCSAGQCSCVRDPSQWAAWMHYFSKNSWVQHTQAEKISRTTGQNRFVMERMAYVFGSSPCRNFQQPRQRSLLWLKSHRHPPIASHWRGGQRRVCTSC